MTGNKCAASAPTRRTGVAPPPLLRWLNHTYRTLRPMPKLFALPHSHLYLPKLKPNSKHKPHHSLPPGPLPLPSITSLHTALQDYVSLHLIPFRSGKVGVSGVAGRAMQQQSVGTLNAVDDAGLMAILDLLVSKR